MKRTCEDIKVILVDDNTVFRNVLRRYLENEYHYKIVATVSSGKEFFDLPKNLKADLVLIDLQMPEMDGYEVGRKLINEFGKVPLIAITMHSEKAYLQELIQLGFRGCVFKPDIYKNLNEAILKVLDNKYYFPDDINL